MLHIMFIETYMHALFDIWRYGLFVNLLNSDIYMSLRSGVNMWRTL